MTNPWYPALAHSETGTSPDSLHADYDPEPLAPLTDEELEGMEEEYRARKLVVPLHRHSGCKHDCISDMCPVMASVKSSLCPSCQYALDNRRRPARG